MHPLLARIHPAFRTALFAWLFSRGALWLISPGTQTSLHTGTPLPGLLDAALLHGQGLVPSGPLTTALLLFPWVLLEGIMLLAGIAIYRFARSTDLPQVAERACWIWFFNPILALTALDWGTQIAAATGALAIASLITHRHKTAAFATVIAVGCRPEFILLWPAVAIAGHRYYRPGKDSSFMPWTALLVPPLAFSAWIGLSWHLAGSAHTSLRSLHGHAIWRGPNDWIPSFPHEILLLLAVAYALVLAFRYTRRLPSWYLVATLPALLWPFVQIPVHFAAITLAWSLPTALHLAIATDDRAHERTLMVALVTAYLFAAFAH